MFTPLDILSIESWILLGTVVLLIRYYIHRQWQVLKELGVPHDPPSLLGLGNLRDYFKNPREFFKSDLENKKKFGKIYGFYLGFQPYIVVWDTQVLKQVQIKEFSTFSDRHRSLQRVNGKIMNTGMNFASGDQWKRLRTTISPVFSTLKLKEMLGLIEQCTNDMVEVLKKKLTKNNGKFETKEVLGKLSLDVICSAAFGVNVHSQEEEEKEPKVIEMIKKLFSSVMFSNPITLLLLLSTSAVKIAELVNYSIISKDFPIYFSSFINAMIKHKKSPEGAARVDILKSMLDNEIDENGTKHAEKGISRNELVGNSVLMILAGYETTSSAMIFLAYNLAVYKKCQEKLRQEIKETVEKHGGLTYEAINSMKYLMMCINESLRIYTPTVRNSRFCEKEITVNGICIPKGVHIDIPMYGLTRDPEYWDDPLEFKPERMEDMTKIDPLIFQPFGAGPRSCIGMRFALMEVKMAISKIIQNFELDVADDTPKPPVDIIFSVSVKPKSEAFHLRVTPLS